MPAPIDPDRRTAIVDAIRAGGSSRASIARQHGVSPRTVQRYADAAGILDAWDTTGTRAATQSAADHRRELRSRLADDILTIDIPRLRERMTNPDAWRKRVVVPTSDGPEVVAMAEDDAAIAKALRELMTAVGIAVDKTIAIDKHDVQGDDDTAADTLGRLFAGLDAAYRVLDNAPPEETP